MENKETARKRGYNKREYKSHLIRIRNDSDLAKCVEKHVERGEVSLNFLVNKLLCEHFNVPLPHKWYETREIEMIYDDGSDS